MSGQKLAIATHDVPQRIFRTMVATTATAVAATLFVVFWMTDAINALSEAKSVQLMENALSAEIQQLSVLTQDYAKWDQAYSWIMDGNETLITDNIGSGATSSGSFDLIFVVDRDLVPLYAFETGRMASNLRIYDADAVAGILPEGGFRASNRIQVPPSFTMVNGQLTLLALTTIAPKEDFRGEQPRPDDLPLLIGGVTINDRTWQPLARKLNLSDMAIFDAEPPLSQSFSSIPLRDRSGTAIAWLGWRADTPGNELRTDSLPLVGVLLALLSLSTIWIARTSARQTAALLREKSQARTDPLTGLINRTGLDELVESDMIKNRLAQGKVAAIYIDLNGFKALNDSLGHACGDEALQITAARLRASVRQDDFLVRMGGDEFVCMIADDTPEASARLVSARINARTTPPIRLNKVEYKVAAAIGIALGEPGIEWSTLVSRADKAMYRAKLQGTSTAVVHSGTGHDDADRQYNRKAS